jgi:hypothetical protein
MRGDNVRPPGKDPRDPHCGEIDVVAAHLNAVRSNLAWIDLRRASFEKLRGSEPLEAEKELDRLKHATEDAMKHLERATELVLAGYTVDPTKRLPRDMNRVRD